jgi:hypothetical protein
VNLKKREQFVGAFSYEEILPKLREELDQVIREKREGMVPPAAPAPA